MPAGFLTPSQTSEVVPGAATVAAVMAAILSAAGEMSAKWTVLASGADYVYMRTIVGSRLPDIRVLIGGDGTGPNAAQMLSPHTSAANNVYIGFAQNSTLTSLANVWNNASAPIADWSKYVRVGASAQTGVTGVWFEYTAESFVLRIRYATTTVHGVYVGAIIQAWTDADGEDTADGIIYGMATSGNNPIVTSDTATGAAWLGNSGSANIPCAMCFDPDAVTTTIKLEKEHLYYLPVADCYKTDGGKTRLPRVGVRRSVGTARCLGYWRGIAPMAPATYRATISKADASFVGFSLSNGVGSDIIGYILHDEG